MNIAVRISLVASVMGLVAIAGSCKSTIENPDHCVNQTGDAWCGEYFGTEKPFCILDRCVDGEAPERGCVAQQPSDDCWSRCGGVSFADDPTCEGVAESGTMSTTGPSTSDPTMGPSPESSVSVTMTMTSADTESESETTPTTTGPTGCDDPEDCGGSTPFCVDEVCVDCGAAEGDASCVALDPGLPLCFDGECVACTEADVGVCEGLTPICDLSNSTCTGCRFHEECKELGAAACHIAEGSCITDSTTVNGSDNSIQPEIDGASEGVPFAIVLNGGGGDHEITIPEGKIIAIVSDDNTEIRDIQGIAGAPTVTVTGTGSIAYLHNVRLLGNTGGVGISAESAATLYADNTRIVQNDAGALAANGSTISIRNSYLSGAPDSTAVALTNTTTTLLYTTIGASTFDTGVTLTCSGGAVTVRNSIVMLQGGAAGEELSCAGGTFTFSAFEGTVPGMGNESLDDLDTGWFSNFTDGVFDLSPSGDSTFADIGQWQDGDPPFDIDGDPRPNTDGAMDYAGADVP